MSSTPSVEGDVPIVDPDAIPPEQLERFARELGLTQAILTGWSPDGTHHVVTWGASLTDSAQAAQGGNAIKRALGFPEFLCRTLSPRVAEALARAEAAGVAAAPEEWVCITCEQRNVTRSDEDRCCLSCGMDLSERGDLLLFLVPDVELAPAPADGSTRFEKGCLYWPGGGMNLALLRALLAREGLQIVEVPR